MVLHVHSPFCPLVTARSAHLSQPALPTCHSPSFPCVARHLFFCRWGSSGSSASRYTRLASTRLPTRTRSGTLRRKAPRRSSGCRSLARGGGSTLGRFGTTFSSFTRCASRRRFSTSRRRRGRAARASIGSR